MKRKNNFECLRCGNKWKSNLERPKQCPACKQPAWDRPARLRRAAKVAVAASAVKSAQDSIFDAIGKAGKS